MPQALQFAAARIEDGDAGIARGDPDAGRACRAPARARAAGRRARATAPAIESLPVCALRNTTPPPSVPIHSPSSLAPARRSSRSAAICIVGAIMAQLAEFIAVETIESVLGAEPHEAFGVLHDGIDGLLRQAFFEAVALHAERRSGEGGSAESAAQRERMRRAQTALGDLFFPAFIDIVDVTDDSRPHRSGARETLCDWRRMRAPQRPLRANGSHKCDVDHAWASGRLRPIDAGHTHRGRLAPRGEAAVHELVMR